MTRPVHSDPGGESYGVNWVAAPNDGSGVTATNLHGLLRAIEHCRALFHIFAVLADATGVEPDAT